jgi:hypothetical protein
MSDYREMFPSEAAAEERDWSREATGPVGLSCEGCGENEDVALHDDADGPSFGQVLCHECYRIAKNEGGWV